MICEPIDSNLAPGPAIDGLSLYDNLLWALRTKDIALYGDLIAPDFVFVDEATATRLTGRQREVEFVKRVFDNSFYIEVQLDETFGRLSPDEAAGQGCQSACGIIQMSLMLRSDETVVLVNDETCLTLCPQRQGDLWHLTRWQVLRSVPTQPGEDEVMESWAAVKEEN
ncbi:MAG: nuclear transport factor 2 family protein [Gemmatimonadetes bacterium]|nr:nuclear transport factor 2 family protein [Gemmatimonadota bacterium]